MRLDRSHSLSTPSMEIIHYSMVIMGLSYDDLQPMSKAIRALILEALFEFVFVGSIVCYHQPSFEYVLSSIEGQFWNGCFVKRKPLFPKVLTLLGHEFVTYLVPIN